HFPYKALPDILSMPSCIISPSIILSPAMSISRVSSAKLAGVAIKTTRMEARERLLCFFNQLLHCRRLHFAIRCLHRPRYMVHAYVMTISSWLFQPCSSLGCRTNEVGE